MPHISWVRHSFLHEKNIFDSQKLFGWKESITDLFMSLMPILLLYFQVFSFHCLFERVNLGKVVVLLSQLFTYTICDVEKFWAKSRVFFFCKMRRRPINFNVYALNNKKIELFSEARRLLLENVRVSWKRLQKTFFCRTHSS